MVLILTLQGTTNMRIGRGNNGAELPISLPLRSRPSNQSAHLSTGEIKEPDGYIYRIQDVGPFTSTGGYDFWQFGWKDTFGLTEVLQEHPDGIIFDSTFSAA